MDGLRITSAYMYMYIPLLPETQWLVSKRLTSNQKIITVDLIAKSLRIRLGLTSKVSAGSTQPSNGCSILHMSAFTQSKMYVLIWHPFVHGRL